MKTEKRLTMALSVLVALMMLAVPLASSSNLFVDGGQTNSNGDAPSLGASTAAGTNGYTITFQLNADGKSLDQVGVDDIVSKLATAGSGATWYKNENGDLCALVKYDSKADVADQITIQKLINDLFDNANAKLITKGDTSIAGAYNLTSWKDTKSNDVYEYAKSSGADNSAVIKSDMTLAAQWELDEEHYIEVPVNVVVDGETKEYYKVYKLIEPKLSQVKIDTDVLNKAILDVAELSLSGIVVYGAAAVKDTSYTQIYKDGVVTYGNSNDLPDDNLISSKSTLTVTYTFNDKSYSKLTVSSAAFEDGKDVTIYADKASVSSLTYDTILAALQSGFKEDGSVAENASDIKTQPIIKVDNAYNGEGKLTDDGYLLSGWNNGAELLDSANFVPSGTTQITLDAELNGYYVIFMSKGAYEIVYVPFGELSAELVKTLDIDGVNHWAYIEYKNSADSTKSYEDLSASSVFTPFTSFTDSVKKTFDAFGKTAVNADDKTLAKKPVAVLVACFDLTGKTTYAAFDAVDGNYGSKDVDKIIVSGTISTNTTKNVIPLPAVSPVYEDEVVFINYVTGDGTPYATSGYGAAYFNNDDAKADVIIYNADVVPYKYAITFYNGSDVVGKFYYDNDLNGSAADMKSGLKAFTYKNISYKSDDLTKPVVPAKPTEPAEDAESSVVEKYNKELEAYNKAVAQNDRYDAATKAYNNILYPAKAGYAISQWKDADGSVMLDKVEKGEKSATDKTIVVTYEVKFDKIKADASFYAAFDAEDYLIAYNGNTATATNNMPQIGTVDSAVNLFSDAAFSNDGYKLKEWNTRPDGKGTTYALGASFTLTGEQYKDLKGVPTGDGLPSDGSYEKGFTLYAIWEKSSSGSGSGNNNEGNNDSNTDTYLLAGILIVIIVLILVVAVVLRKKQ